VHTYFVDSAARRVAGVAVRLTFFPAF
jgi:hypothetical protein